MNQTVSIGCLPEYLLGLFSTASTLPPRTVSESLSPHNPLVFQTEAFCATSKVASIKFYTSQIFRRWEHICIPKYFNAPKGHHIFFLFHPQDNNFCAYKLPVPAAIQKSHQLPTHVFTTVHKK